MTKSFKLRALSAAVAVAVLFSAAVQYKFTTVWADDDGTDNGMGSSFEENSGGTEGSGEEINEEKTNGEENSGEEFGETQDSSTSITSLSSEFGILDNDNEIILNEVQDGDSGNDWSVLGGIITISNPSGLRITGTTDKGIKIDSDVYGASIILDDAIINSSGVPGIEINVVARNFELILVGDSVVSSDSDAGIQVSGGFGSYLAIEEEERGSLRASGGGGGAGIGVLGTIIRINGGTVIANGSGSGAGIGASGSGLVEINGGDVTATGGLGGGAGIGQLSATDDVVVRITGGMVKATGGGDGAGIESKNSIQLYRWNNSDPYPAVYTSSLVVHSGEELEGNHKGILEGILFIGNKGTLYGEYNGYTVDDLNWLDFSFLSHTYSSYILEIPMNLHLTVEAGETLVIPSNLTVRNYGTIDVLGIIDNQGNIENYGVIDITPPGEIKGKAVESGGWYYAMVAELEETGYGGEYGTLTIQNNVGMEDWRVNGRQMMIDAGMADEVDRVIIESDVINSTGNPFAGGFDNIARVTFMHTSPPFSNNFSAFFNGLSNLCVIQAPNATNINNWNFDNVNGVTFHSVKYSTIGGGKIDEARITYMEVDGNQAPNGAMGLLGTNSFIRSGDIMRFSVHALPDAGSVVLAWRNGEKGFSNATPGVFIENDFDNNGSMEYKVTRISFEFGDEYEDFNEDFDLIVEFSLDPNVTDTIETGGNSAVIPNAEAVIDIDIGTVVMTEEGAETIYAGNIFSLTLNIEDESGISNVSDLLDFLGDENLAAEFIEEVQNHIEANKFNSEEAVALGFDISLLLHVGYDSNNPDGGHDVKVIDMEGGMIAATFAIPPELANCDLMFFGVHKNAAGETELLKFTIGENMFINNDGTLTLHLSQFSNYFLMGTPKAKPVGPGPLVIDGGNNSRSRGPSRTVVTNTESLNTLDNESNELEQDEQGDETEETGLNEENNLTVESPVPLPPPPPPTSSNHNLPSAPTTTSGNGGNSVSTAGSSAPSRTRQAADTSEENRTPGGAYTDGGADGGLGLDEQGNPDTNTSADTSGDTYYAEANSEGTGSTEAAGTAVSPVAGREGTKSANTNVPLAVAAVAGTAAVGGGAAFAVKGLRVKFK